MIQGRAEIVYAVSNYQPEAVGHGIGTGNSETPVVSAAAIVQLFRRWIRVRLINDSIGLALDPSVGLALESLQMFACPIEFNSETLDSATLANG